MRAGTYKVKLQLTDRAAYTAKTGESPSWKTKTVERWFNSEAERDDLFARWAAKGIRATLGRFVGV